MKKLAEMDEKKKTLFLIIGIVVVFAIVVIRVTSSMNGGSAGPAEVVAIGGPAGAGGAAPAGGGASAATVKPVEVAPVTISPGVNPFHRPTPPPPDKMSLNGTPGGAGVLPPGAIMPVRGPIGPDPRFDLKPEPQPVIQVMGFVNGKNPVVVLKVGAKDYVVQKGELFGRDLRIKAVTNTQVIISEGKTLHILRVGGSTADEPPPAPVAAPVATPPVNPATAANPPPIRH